MEKYRKKSVVEIVYTLENGDKLVQNEGDSSDKWVIPKDVFEKTYEPVSEN